MFESFSKGFVEKESTLYKMLWQFPFFPKTKKTLPSKMKKRKKIVFFFLILLMDSQPERFYPCAQTLVLKETKAISCIFSKVFLAYASLKKDDLSIFLWENVVFWKNLCKIVLRFPPPNGPPWDVWKWQTIGGGVCWTTSNCNLASCFTFSLLVFRMCLGCRSWS